MVDEDVALADDGEHVGGLALVALQARLGDRRPRRVPQLVEPLQAGDLHEVVEVQQALERVDLRLLHGERLAELVAQRGAHARVDLEPHDLAEPAPAQLLLDGLQEVVGLVGDLEVRVARHAEDPVVDDLHAREERVEVGRDDVLHVTKRRSSPSPTWTKRGSSSLGTLTRANVVVWRLRVAHEDGQRHREVGDVRERAPEPDGERREHREDLAAEALVDAVALLAGELVERDDRDAVLGQLGAQLVLDAARLALGQRRDAHPQLVEDLLRRPAVRPGLVDPGVDLVEHPATRIMKNSSRFEVKIAANFTRSRSGTAASSASSSTRSLKSTQESSRLS